LLASVVQRVATARWSIVGAMRPTPRPVQLEVEELDATVQRLRAPGVTLRNEVVEGQGGRQRLSQDPARNLVELFEPRPR